MYEGTFDGSKVYLKRVRRHTLESPEISAKVCRGYYPLSHWPSLTTSQTFREEAVTWKYLDHPNVLRFQGVTTKPLQIISDWMPGGTLPEYIKKNPGADRIQLVGAAPNVLISDLPPQLSGVAKGLDYLHSRNVIHGVIKGVRDHPKSHFVRALIPGQRNILVDAEGRARIMGFRFAKVTPNEDSGQTVSNQHVGSKQWSAPEVLEDGEMSQKSDIFSFAMVMIEARHG